MPQSIGGWVILTRGIGRNAEKKFVKEKSKTRIPSGF